MHCWGCEGRLCARVVPAPSRRQAGAGACCGTGQGEGALLDQPCPARAIPISTVRGWGAVSPLGQPVAMWGGRALGQPHRCWAPTPRTRTGEKWSLPGKVELSSALPSSADLAAADLGLQHPDAWPCSARERFLALDEAEVRAVSRADLQSASSSWRMGLTERGGSHQARAWAELKLKTLLLTLAWEGNAADAGGMRKELGISQHRGEEGRARLWKECFVLLSAPLLGWRARAWRCPRGHSLAGCWGCGAVGTDPAGIPRVGAKVKGMEGLSSAWSSRRARQPPRASPSSAAAASVAPTSHPCL